MYRYLDRPILELAPGAALLIRTMREWVAATQAGRCPCRTTAHRFGAAGLGGVAPDFGLVMATLNRDSLGSLHFLPPGCARVGEDEARLLTLFDGPVEGDGKTFKRLAAALVDEVAVPRLMRAVAIVAAQIAASQVSTRFD